MRIGIIGSGTVGQTIGAKLVELGHEVKVGTRDPRKLDEWLRKVGRFTTAGSTSEAAAFSEILFHCTAGAGALDALGMAGEENLRGKILVDISNPLDFSRGMPPSLLVCNTDSLGERIQRRFPDAKVVKTLNTVTAPLMVNPWLLPGPHSVFVSGNDPQAKATVADILKSWFGWQSVVDLGDITTARAAEMWLPLWIQLMGALKTPMFNIRLVRQ